VSKLVIEIRMDGAAFEDNTPLGEVRAILQRYLQTAEDFGFNAIVNGADNRPDIHSFPNLLRDTYGNRCGSAQVTED
jgi:hypothetical protein